MCEPASENSERAVAKALQASSCFAQDASKSAGCQLDQGILSDFTLLTTTSGNFTGLYPPLYYTVMHVFASTNLEASVLGMRFFTILIFVSFTLLLWKVAPREMRMMQQIPWLITSIPLGFFIVASTNPSSWSFIGVGIGTLALYGFLSADEFYSRAKLATLAALYLVAAFLATGSRGDSAAFVTLGATLVVVLTFIRARFFFRRLTVALIPIVIGAFFFLLSRQSSSVATSGFGVPDETLTPQSVFVNNLFSFPSLYFGALGGWGLGWIDTTIPLIVPSAMTIAFVGFVVLAWQKMSRRQLVVQIVVVSVMVILPLYILQASMQVVGQSLQPRYLLPLIFLLALTSIQILQQVQFGGSQFFRVYVWLALSFSYGLALLVNLSRYLYGDAGLSSFPSEPEWWWSGLSLSPISIALTGFLAFSALTFVILRPDRTIGDTPLDRFHSISAST